MNVHVYDGQQNYFSVGLSTTNLVTYDFRRMIGIGTNVAGNFSSTDTLQMTIYEIS